MSHPHDEDRPTPTLKAALERIANWDGTDEARRDDWDDEPTMGPGDYAIAAWRLMRTATGATTKPRNLARAFDLPDPRAELVQAGAA